MHSLDTRKGKRKWNERSFVQACILRSIQQAKEGGALLYHEIHEGILEPVEFLAEQSNGGRIWPQTSKSIMRFQFLHIGIRSSTFPVFFPSLKSFSRRGSCVAAFAEVFPCHRCDFPTSGCSDMTWLFRQKRGVEDYFLPRPPWRCEDWTVSVEKKKYQSHRTVFFLQWDYERLHKFRLRIEPWRA